MVRLAVDLRKRLLQHRRTPKLAWTRAVAIKRDTSHGFNSAEIGYLEGRLAAEIGAMCTPALQPGPHGATGHSGHGSRRNESEYSNRYAAVT